MLLGLVFAFGRKHLVAHSKNNSVHSKSESIPSLDGAQRKSLTMAPHGDKKEMPVMGNEILEGTIEVDRRAVPGRKNQLGKIISAVLVTRQRNL